MTPKDINRGQLGNETLNTNTSPRDGITPKLSSQNKHSHHLLPRPPSGINFLVVSPDVNRSGKADDIIHSNTIANHELQHHYL